MRTWKSLGWNWKSFIAAFVIAALINGFASAAFGTKPAKNILWTTMWIYLTIEAWKYWKWKALLPYPIYFLAVFVTVGIMASVGADGRGPTYPIVVFALNIGGLTIFGWLLWLEKTHHQGDHADGRELDGNAYMERILREADARAVKESRRVVAYPMSEEARKNQEFVALLKSAAYENKLDMIPNEDLLEICKRARSIEDASSKNLDIELSRVINTFLAEIQKRGLSYP